MGGTIVIFWHAADTLGGHVTFWYAIRVINGQKRVIWPTNVAGAMGRAYTNINASAFPLGEALTHINTTASALGGWIDFVNLTIKQ